VTEIAFGKKVEGTEERRVKTAFKEVTLPAFLLARESAFFRAALTDGFKEAKSRVINYKAESTEGAC
jgi:hypothetical protein